MNYMEEIIFNPNQFFRVARYYETPIIYILDHWVTKEFGFRVFKSGNFADRWIYIDNGRETYMATPEFLDDRLAAECILVQL